MKKILSSTAYLVVNKEVAKRVGLKEAVLLADLISKEIYFTDNNLLIQGYFYNTEDNIKNDTTLTPYQQRKCLKSLVSKGLIEVKRMGVPAKLHYKVSEEQVVKLLNNKTSKKQRTINKNKEKTTINKSISIRAQEFTEQVFFSNYPTEVCQEFCEYWTETNPKGTKMKFEMQKTFDIKRRLARWSKNNQKWNKTKTSKIDAQLNNYKQAKKTLGL
tara:strand:+ start:343 stop:990 length:648 start_codon:yes stop_codon:yes gene_type:complete